MATQKETARLVVRAMAAVNSATPGLADSALVQEHLGAQLADAVCLIRALTLPSDMLRRKDREAIRQEALDFLNTL